MDISNFTGSGDTKTDAVEITNALVVNSEDGFIVTNATEININDCVFKGVGS
jgi:hypothetical protein